MYILYYCFSYCSIPDVLLCLLQVSQTGEKACIIQSDGMVGDRRERRCPPPLPRDPGPVGVCRRGEGSLRHARVPDREGPGRLR